MPQFNHGVIYFSTVEARSWPSPLIDGIVTADNLSIGTALKTQKVFEGAKKPESYTEYKALILAHMPHIYSCILAVLGELGTLGWKLVAVDHVDDYDPLGNKHFSLPYYLITLEL